MYMYVVVHQTAFASRVAGFIFSIERLLHRHVATIISTGSVRIIAVVYILNSTYVDTLSLRIGVFKFLWTNTTEVVVSFDCFGTLVDVRVPSDPGGAVATALSNRGVSVPVDWSAAYSEAHVDVPRGAEVSLTEHVVRAMESRGFEPDREQCSRAVAEAFAPEVRTRPGARVAIEAAARYGRVGICSNCSVSGLVARTLDRSAVDHSFDAVVTSVGCGWRKPDPRAFETVSERLGGSVESLVHVGDDPDTDGGVQAIGGTFIDVSDRPLSTVPAQLEVLEGR